MISAFDARQRWSRWSAAGVAVAGHDVAHDAEAGHPGDVADDQRKLEIHLDERLLPVRNDRTRRVSVLASAEVSRSNRKRTLRVCVRL